VTRRLAAVVAAVAVCCAGTGATARTPALRSERWLFELDGRGTSFDAVVEATVAPGQVGVLAYALGLRNAAKQPPYAVAAPYMKVFGAPRFAGQRATVTGTSVSACDPPLTCSMSADGRRLRVPLHVDTSGSNQHATFLLFVRAATVKVTPRGLGRWRLSKRAGDFAVVMEDGAITADAQGQRVTVGPLTYTTSRGASVAVAGMTCKPDERAFSTLTGGGEVDRQECPDAHVTGLATAPTTWTAVVAGRRDDQRPAAMLVARL
jgi:hypothetical protein